MSYYHEARAHVKALKQMTEDNKRRQERRAELFEAQNEHPLHALRLDGRSCAVHASTEQYEAIERQEGLIPWQGGPGGGDNLIDRFDGRAMLDMYVPPRPGVQRPKTDEEVELEEMVDFESYRDLIPLMQKRLAEEQGILEAERQNVALRASARSAANAAAGITERPSMPADTPAFPPSLGAVGFQYGGEVAESSSSEEDSGSDMELEEEEEAVGLAVGPASDEVAKEFGLSNFEVLLRREVKREEAEGLGQHKPRKKHKSRKKFAERARRMAGQGLDPYAGMKKDSVSYRWRDDRLPERDFVPRSRASPEYEAFPEARAKDASSKGLARGGEAQQVEFITEFAIGEQSALRVQPYVETESRRPAGGQAARPAFRDAMPSKMDPGVEGPVALPSAGSTVHGIRAADLAEREAQLERERRAAERAREREWLAARETGSSRRSRSRSRSPGRGRRDPPGRSKRRSSRGRSRSRSRDRRRSSSRSRSRSRSAGRGRRRSGRHGSSDRSRSRSRSRSRRESRRTSRSRSRSPDGRRGRPSRSHRSRSPERRRDRGRSGDHRSRSRSWSRGAERRPERPADRSRSPARREASSSKAPAAAPAPAKETPAERMKRIMAAQLNKQVQKAKLGTTQKKVQEERDRLAREQQQRAAGLHPNGRYF